MDMDQHFLVNEGLIYEVLRALDVKDDDKVIELGSGMGTISRKIPMCKTLTLVEKDPSLCQYIGDFFQYDPDVVIINQDGIEALKADDSNLVLSCLPWHMTEEVIKTIIDREARIDRAVVFCPQGTDLHLNEPWNARALFPIQGDNFEPAQPKMTEVWLLENHG